MAAESVIAIKAIDKTRAGLQSAERGFGSLGLKAALMGAAIGGAGLALKELHSIGEQWREVEKTITAQTGAMGAELESLKGVIRDIASETPSDIGELARAMTHLEAVSEGDNLREMLERVDEQARLTGESVVSLAQQTQSAFSVFAGSTSEDFEALAAIARITRSSMSELLTPLQSYGPVLANMGFSVREAASFIGKLNESGIAASRVFPGINAAMRRWADEGVEDLRGAMNRTIVEIQQAKTSTEALQIATDAFGAEGAQRLSHFFRESGVALEDFTLALGPGEGALISQAGAAVGALDEMEASTRTLGDNLAVLRNRVTALVEPIATDAANWIVELTSGGQRTIDAADDLIPALLGFPGDPDDFYADLRAARSLVEALGSGVQSAIAIVTGNANAQIRTVPLDVKALLPAEGDAVWIELQQIAIAEFQHLRHGVITEWSELQAQIHESMPLVLQRNLEAWGQFRDDTILALNVDHWVYNPITQMFESLEESRSIEAPALQSTLIKDWRTIQAEAEESFDVGLWAYNPITQMFENLSTAESTSGPVLTAAARARWAEMKADALSDLNVSNWRNNPAQLMVMLLTAGLRAEAQTLHAVASGEWAEVQAQAVEQLAMVQRTIAEAQRIASQPIYVTAPVIVEPAYEYVESTPGASAAGSGATVIVQTGDVYGSDDLDEVIAESVNRAMESGAIR